MEHLSTLLKRRVAQCETLHAQNIAVMAGAQGPDIDRVADAMASEGSISVDRAREILGEK